MSDKMNRRAPVAIDVCGMAQTAQLLGEKWTLLILREVFYGVTRFSDIQADIGIPKAMLTKRLKHLVEIQILQRREYQEPNSRARNAYLLTPSGRELATPLLAMMAWGDKYHSPGKSRVTLINKNSGAALKIGVIEDQQPEVPLDEITLRIDT